MRGGKVSERKMNVDSTKSRRRGVGGFIESLLRRFRTPMHIVMVMPLYLLACLLLGTAMLPGALLWQLVYSHVADWSPVVKTLALTSTGAAAYFCYAFSMIIVVPFGNFAMRTQLKAWRGPYYSLGAVPWYIHNGSTYLVRYTVLEFLTPTPFNLLFYKLMGMRVGNGTIINTTHISDPSLITLGKKVTLGGSVTIVGHYGQGGFLVLAPVTIGDRVTVGLKASIMGGAQIGKEAKIMPHSVVMPKTVIGEGETWGGVPAVRIDGQSRVKKAAA